MTEHTTTDQIRPGCRFDTDFETGCEVVGEVDTMTDSFDARDSDGVVCSFSVEMVRNLRPASSVHGCAEFACDRDAVAVVFDIPDTLGTGSYAPVEQTVCEHHEAVAWSEGWDSFPLDTPPALAFADRVFHAMTSAPTAPWWATHEMSAGR